MATGTPPEVILSRYESSFTAHKGALNDFVKSYKKKRATFQRTVMNPVILEIAKDAIQQGYISAPGFFQGGEMIQQAYLQGMYLAPVVITSYSIHYTKLYELQVKPGSSPLKLVMTGVKR